MPEFLSPRRADVPRKRSTTLATKRRPDKTMDIEHDRISLSEGDAILEEPAFKRQRVSSQPSREVGLMRRIPGENVFGFVGSASGIYFIRSVYSALRRSRNTTTSVDDPGSDTVPGEDDRLSIIQPDASARLWRDQEVAENLMAAVSFEDLVEWSGSYFINWHPYYPFLDAPTVLQYLEMLSSANGPREDIPEDFDAIILRSIMSISLADLRQSKELELRRYPADLVFTSFDHALDSLRLILKRPTSLKSLQAAMGVQIFLISMLRLNAASRVGGLIIRMAAQLGLHRCPARFASFSSAEAQLRQRMFWSIYTIDRFLSQSMGLPLGLQDDDIDVCYPCDEHHHESTVPSRTVVDARLKPLDLLARHARIRGEIIELRNKSLHFVQRDPDKATSITARLTQWSNDVDEFRDISASTDAGSYFDVLLVMLQHEAIISLHRPVLAAASKDATYEAALQHCIGSARCIISALHGAITNQDHRPSLCLLWPSSTWAVWISTFILFYAANAKYIADEIVTRFAERSLEVLKHISARGCSWPEACSAAIRDLLVRMCRQGPESPEGTRSTCDAIGPVEPPMNNNTEGTLLNTGGVPPYVTMTDLPFEQLYDGDGTWTNLQDWSTSLNTDPASVNSTNIDPFFGFDIPFWFEKDQNDNVFSM